MKINKEAAVAMLVALGFPKAGEWDDEKLADRLKQAPSKIDITSVPEKHLTTYERIVEAAKGEIELEGGEQDEVDSGKEEKEERKPAKRKEIDVSDMSLTELRSLVEERELKVSKGALKNVEVLRVEVKKALKAGPRRSTVDRAVDKAAKTGKGGRNAEESEKEKKKGKGGRDVEEPEKKKGGGSSRKGVEDPNSIRAKVTKCLTNKWQSDEEVTEEVGLPFKQVRSALRRKARKKLIEVRKRVEYRLVQEKSDKK